MQTNKLYDERLELYKKTIKFENERPSTAYGGPATPAAHMGMTIKDYIFDTKRGFKAYIDYINLLNNEAPVDVINTPYAGLFHIPISMMWLSKVKAPGIELPDNSLWQVMEKEMMKVEDYDKILEQGWAEFQQEFLPKVLDMKDLQKFIEYQMAEGPEQAKAMIDNSYPLVNSMGFTPPFEALCGARSMTKFFMDCYKLLDKIKDVQDVMFPVQIEGALQAMKQSNAIGGWVGGWRGASGMVSPKIWDTLVWPYMKKAGDKLLENGFIPIFHLDQNWDRDIERFLEMPRQSCILNTDGMTDLKRARKLLGDHVAFMGDVPAPLLSNGTPETVSDYVKELLDSVGPKGMMITSGCDTPANAKFENVVAMYKTAVDYK
ncbi:uroporphyrinogen decarboxylase family protein [Alkalibacter mobilis]|uniref:uroporphyrinogen decarboxylase family protein n=1 Tax=Alkalibacter mobilis TaxID=2787712 RepID=UPI00189F023E|nr:uroporphyrinogen decarboxylase family protein [Alkalibacter mobilis]MBF7095675.1 methyltransferase [Alkalibacter mobilis]